MKKIISLLLVIMIVLSISACGNETTIDNDTGSSTTQNQTDVTDTSSTEQSRDTPSSTTDNSGASDSTDVPDSTTSKPTTTTKPETSKPSTTTKPSTPTHTHSYSDATCTEPAKCSCGATNGSALGHSYGNATCTEAKKCSRCGATNGSALGHSYSNATCTEAKKCSRCGATNGSALGHTYVNDYCVVCNKKNPDSWQFKNGGNDHIIKYNNATSQKINIDTKHFDLPADDPNGEYIIVYEIQRNHIAQIGEWIYFEEKIEYHNEYIKETESGNYPGIFGSIHKLCRIKLDGTMFEEISTVSAKSGERLARILGFDGNTMYFLKYYGWEPGGNICAVDLSKKYNNIIDDAIVYNRSILFPLSSYIENGIIYLKEDPDFGGGTSEIAIASLK